jgi:hypothetical protein
MNVKRKSTRSSKSRIGRSRWAGAVSFLFGIGCSFLWCVPPSATGGQGASSSTAAPDTPGQAVLRISTGKPVPLHKEIHSASTADIFFTKRPLGSRNILADPFVSLVKDLNLQSLGFEEEASANFHHVVIGDTQVYGGQGDGYNIDPEEVKKRGMDPATLFDGMGVYRFGKDFFNEYCTLLEKLGLPGTITANAQTGNIEEALWQIERAHARRVVFGLELVTRNHRDDFPAGKAYVEKITPWVLAVRKAFPDVAVVLDAAWDSKPAHDQWNRDLRDMEGDQIRIYLWDRDLYESVTAPDAASRIHEAFAVVLPPIIARIHQAFPDKKIAVLQWGLKPGLERYNTVFGCLHVAKMYQWMITFNRDNDNLIDYASFTNLTNLLLGKKGIACHYYALKLCGQLFEGAPNVLESSMAGVRGVDVVCCEEQGRRTLLMINENSRAVAVSSILIDGSPAGHQTFHQEAVYGGEVDSDQVVREEGNVEAIVLKPYSVNLVRF